MSKSQKPFASRPLPFAKRRKSKEEKERSAYWGKVMADRLQSYFKQNDNEQKANS